MHLMSCRCLSLSPPNSQEKGTERESWGQWGALATPPVDTTCICVQSWFSSLSLGHADEYLPFASASCVWTGTALMWAQTPPSFTWDLPGHHGPAWQGQDYPELIQPWHHGRPVICLNLALASSPSACLSILDFWLKLSAIPGVALPLGCCRAGSEPGRSWGCCLVYHPQLLAPSALGSSCSLLWAF